MSYKKTVANVYSSANLYAPQVIYFAGTRMNVEALKINVKIGMLLNRLRLNA